MENAQVSQLFMNHVFPTMYCQICSENIYPLKKNPYNFSVVVSWYCLKTTNYYHRILVKGQFA